MSILLAAGEVLYAEHLVYGKFNFFMWINDILCSLWHFSKSYYSILKWAKMGIIIALVSTMVSEEVLPVYYESKSEVNISVLQIHG